MGTWSFGPFDNDSAADFLDEAAGSPARAVTAALRAVARAEAGAYLDVDDGAAAWAACELVALAFGRGDAAAIPDAAREVLAALRPSEPQRRVALEVLPRIGHRESSELAGLWHEGDEGARRAPAAGAGRVVAFEEARGYDVERVCDETTLVALALGTPLAARLRSPDEQVADLRAKESGAWAERRAVTTPGPFGDVEELATLLDWYAELGAASAVEVFHREAIGAQGYGRPKERDERRSYAFAGLVALWNGGLPADAWPAALDARRPAPPPRKLMPQALAAARLLVEQVVTFDAALRLVWDDAPDGGAALRAAVEVVRSALTSARA